MEWQPAPDSLRQLAAYLKESLSGLDRNVQQRAELMLRQAKNSPDFVNYLAYIFSTVEPSAGLQMTPTDYHLVRSAAAIMIKNSIREGLKKIPLSSLALVKLATPICIQDNNAQIRNYAGSIASTLLMHGGLLSWPGILPDLLDLMDNSSGQASAEAQEGAASAMAKICEDNAKTLWVNHNGQKPLQYILPKLIGATNSPLPAVRTYALTAINIFTPRKTQIVLQCIDSLLPRLFDLASDTNSQVRRQVCRAFVNLVETRPDKIQPYIEGLVDYIITQQRSDDDELACDAAEFWLSVGEHSDLWRSLGPFIQRIIPVLLDCMVHSGEEIALLGGESDDEDEPDRLEDIRPAVARKIARTMNDKGPTLQHVYEKLASMDRAVEDGEISDDDDDDIMNAGPDERWTIRKSSAAALDVFARDFNAPVFECVMPYLTNNLKHTEWPMRESAVLALGAIADGCMQYVSPHLPELIPYLISLLEDAEPVVRKITCWTLGRYAAWAAHLSDPSQRVAYFEPVIEGILRKMLDKNKKVQDAACSAFANLEEKAGRGLEPYCVPIIQQFVLCFEKYKDKNMYILYDCVQTLAEHMGPVLAKPENAELLMPALNGRYAVVQDDSRELFPLLECLSYVALALNDGFAPFARPTFLRCIKIITTTLEKSIAALDNRALDKPDKDFLVTSLDLLSAIIQALDDAKAAELVKESAQSFFELMILCMEDPADEVRQSAYALLGDCSKYVFQVLQPRLPAVLAIAVKQIDLDQVLDEEAEGSMSAINNACWAVGEIAMRYGKGMAPFIPELLPRFKELFDNPEVPNGVTENAAIALGRLGLENSEQLGPFLSTFARDFLNTMKEVDESEEKGTAFKGFTLVVGQNPLAMEPFLLQYFVTIAKYKDLHLKSPMKMDLHGIFQSAINVYKQMIPHFDQFIGQMTTRDQESLRRSFVL